MDNPKTTPWRYTNHSLGFSTQWSEPSAISSRIRTLRLNLHASLLVVLFSLFSLAAIHAPAQSDSLPSWNDGVTKQAIEDFVTRTTTAGSPDFVPPEDRIAVFDNDGTLWTEQPLYTEFAFVLDRVKQLAPQHPDWQTKEPYAAVLHHDNKALAATGERGMYQMLVATHANLTTDQFSKIVSDWIGSAEHPRFKRPYTQCIYQPMLEVLTYFRAHGFKTYIVSGGDQDFMRPWAAAVYGIPSEQIVGTTLKTKFAMVDGQPVLNRLPQIDSIDDGPGKPENINKVIGKRPIAAFGNSDGDLQMLEWTASAPGLRLMVLVHHTDAQREYAYDRQSSVGRLDKALDEATARHWLVIDMKNDWKTIFPAPQ
jgi:phosphoserine phosphatase